MDSERSDSVVAERVTIRGPVRWALTDRGRIIIQFADEQDLIAALALWDRGPTLARRADESTLELQLPVQGEPERTPDGYRRDRRPRQRWG